MRRSLLTLFIALALACVVMALIGGSHAVVVSLEILLPLACLRF